MDFFENPNWGLTKFLLSCFGAWPFQRPLLRKVIRCFVVTALISILIPEICKLITVRKDLNLSMECVPILALHCLTIVKMMNCFFNLKRNKLLLIRIRKDWEEQLPPADMKLMAKNARSNRRITHAYIYYIYATTIMYLSGPLVPRVLDLVAPLNESRPPMELYPTEYFVDPVRNQVPILMHAYAISPFPSTIIVAFDALYCNCVYHACSIFEIVGNRLQSTMKIMPSIERRNKLHDDLQVHGHLKECIRLHRRSLKFARLLQATYSHCFLGIVMINMIALSITGYQVVRKLDEPSEVIRYGTFSIGQIVHLYFLSYPAQKLMDQSERVYSLTYQGNWYNLPGRSRKLLVFIMMRSRIPCILTAGKIYIMSSQSFAAVVKTSMSYFTVLLSTR